METIKLTVTESDAGIRADKYISENCGQLSRSYIQKLAGEGLLCINGKPAKDSQKLKSGDKITLTVPENEPPKIEPEDIKLDIYYEDSDVIVINKPRGMVVHPAAGHYSETLVNALMYHCKDLSGINGVLRPGIVHRIDRDTSGLLICAKNDFAHSSLAKQLKEHSIKRVYEAICCGTFNEKSGAVCAPVGRDEKDRKKMAVNKKNGKEAVTHYKVLEEFPGYSHIECVLETGRTHQIRVHMKSIGHPLVGDFIYGGKKTNFKAKGEEVIGQALHAGVLGFVHPGSGQYLEFRAEPPEYFKDILEELKKRRY